MQQGRWSSDEVGGSDEGGANDSISYSPPGKIVVALLSVRPVFVCKVVSCNVGVVTLQGARESDTA
jgi:hypothetical protein